MLDNSLLRQLVPDCISWTGVDFGVLFWFIKNPHFFHINYFLERSFLLSLLTLTPQWHDPQIVLKCGKEIRLCWCFTCGTIHQRYNSIKLFTTTLKPQGPFIDTNFNSPIKLNQTKTLSRIYSLGYFFLFSRQFSPFWFFCAISGTCSQLCKLEEKISTSANWLVLRKMKETSSLLFQSLKIQLFIRLPKSHDLQKRQVSLCCAEYIMVAWNLSSSITGT